ncbi:transcriptional regulator [Brevibacillus sp. SKDU10]|uniref:pro-sigmaK processing inhibitor BofA family protein n=1 Tax=Brevibacillus sp. SKDU10 TaxID=1247872 RepID=UPI0007C8AC42|nr:pro-sigmaK processing inhibitor BofA family protein [Brevibacillus sp. SKDU10]OAJ72819.1 transcriptional regulator [Brevibacillus sp. SKDU10]
MNTEIMIAGMIIGFLVLVALSRSVSRPLRWTGTIAINVIIGAILLYFSNFFGEMAGFYVPINPVTAIIAGFLRIPGLLALIVIRLFLLG